MATKTKQTPKIQAEHQIEYISTSLIVASKSNPRQSFEKENIKDLADSMASVGLLQPVTLRASGKNTYELVAGERRWRAAKLLKWETIPAIVRVISDDEMLEVQIIENLQREDVSPLDEAHAFQTLLKKETIDWLASKIHKSKKYILDRLKLNELVPEAAEYVSKGVLPLGHAVVISKLSFADQKACLDKCLDNKYVIGEDDLEYCKMPLDDLKEFISDHIMLEFDRAPFDKDDTTLYVSAGSCATCLKRTCNSNLLFQDITNEDKCTDASCYQEKIKLHVEREKSKAKEKYGSVLSGEKDTYSNGSTIKVQGVNVPVQKTPGKNSIPVVITKVDKYGSSRSFLGTTVYIDKNKIEQVKLQKSEDKKASTSDRNNNLSYEERRLQSLKKNWGRVQFIEKGRIPSDLIVNMYLRDKLEDLFRNDEFIALLGMVDMLPGVKDAETAIAKREELEELEDFGNNEEFATKTEIINKILESHSTDSVLQLIMLLNRIDDEEGETYDHDDSFGYSWDEMVAILEPAEKKETPKKSSSKK